jgi:hypothetical protein
MSWSADTTGVFRPSVIHTRIAIEARLTSRPVHWFHVKGPRVASAPGRSVLRTKSMRNRCIPYHADQVKMSAP